jgi:hypothetical protein
MQGFAIFAGHQTTQCIALDIFFEGKNREKQVKVITPIKLRGFDRESVKLQ